MSSFSHIFVRRDRKACLHEQSFSAQVDVRNDFGRMDKTKGVSKWGLGHEHDRISSNQLAYVQCFVDRLHACVS